MNESLSYCHYCLGPLPCYACHYKSKNTPAAQVPTPTQLENACRIACRLRGEDPDKKVPVYTRDQTLDEDGRVDVMRWYQRQPLWKRYEKEILNLWVSLTAIDQAKRTTQP